MTKIGGHKLRNKQKLTLKVDKKMKKRATEIVRHAPISAISHEKIEWWEGGTTKLLFLSLGLAKGTSTIFSPFSPSSLNAIISELIFMAQREIMGILSNVENVCVPFG